MNQHKIEKNFRVASPRGARLEESVSKSRSERRATTFNPVPVLAEPTPSKIPRADESLATGKSSKDVGEVRESNTKHQSLLKTQDSRGGVKSLGSRA
jgi:hypothetical protein